MHFVGQISHDCPHLPQDQVVLQTRNLKAYSKPHLQLNRTSPACVVHLPIFEFAVVAADYQRSLRSRIQGTSRSNFNLSRMSCSRVIKEISEPHSWFGNTLLHDQLIASILALTGRRRREGEESSLENVSKDESRGLLCLPAQEVRNVRCHE